jgi:hypothetical protein
MIRLYAQAPKGQRAVGSLPQQRGKNMSFIEVLTLNVPLAAFQCVDSMDGLTFEAYLIQRVIPHLWPGLVSTLTTDPFTTVMWALRPH